MTAARETLFQDARCAQCGHPATEHRAEVLPFAACHHLDGEQVDDRHYSVTPCWCPNYAASAA